MEASGVRIEPTRESDLGAISRLADERALPDEPHDGASRTGFLVSGYTVDDYRDLLSRADHFYVARHDGEVIGFVLGYGRDRVQPDEWLNNQVKQHMGEFVVIKQVCVHPNHASRGVASLLYQRVLERCPGVPVVAAVVSDPPNEPSTRLHRKHGFEPFLSLTPPGGRPSTVWIRRRRDLNALLAGYGTAAQLYLHEDNLNWLKLHHFLYVTIGLFAAFGFVLSLSQTDSPAAPWIALLMAITGIGMMSAASFWIALHWGVRYMDARKDALNDVEQLLVRAGGAPVATKTSTYARHGWLRRSPTRITLRTIPVVVGLCWVGAGVTALVLF